MFATQGTAQEIENARVALALISGAIVKTCGWEPHRPSGDMRLGRRCCHTRW
jgi:hypothetical protein